METTTKTKPDKASHSDLHERIASVERRLENRRTRLLEDARETTQAAGQAATKVVPIAAAAGAGLLAMYLMRRRKPAPRYVRYDEYGYVPDADQRRRVRWASLAGIVGTVIRIATSPQFRAIVHNFAERRRRGY